MQLGATHMRDEKHIESHLIGPVGKRFQGILATQIEYRRRDDQGELVRFSISHINLCLSCLSSEITSAKCLVYQKQYFKYDRNYSFLS